MHQLQRQKLRPLILGLVAIFCHQAQMTMLP
jgi:hypothetical protein